MIRYLAALFSRPAPQPEPIRPGDSVPAGLRVRMAGSPDVGTVSAFVAGPNGTQARVVFVAPKRTWIQTVSLHRLEL
jgi:hypothetical protein